jgi:hypothetical protein
VFAAAHLGAFVIFVHGCNLQALSKYMLFCYWPFDAHKCMSLGCWKSGQRLGTSEGLKNVRKCYLMYTTPKGRHYLWGTGIARQDRQTGSNSSRSLGNERLNSLTKQMISKLLWFQETKEEAMGEGAHACNLSTSGGAKVSVGGVLN